MTSHNRFPLNNLKPLYTGHRKYDLSESTTKDLAMGDMIDLIGLDAVRNISLDYGESIAGLDALRHEIGLRCGVDAETVVTTQGAAFALYLVSAEIGTPGDKAIIPAPYFAQSYNTLIAHGWDVTVVQNDLDDGYKLNVDTISAALDADTKLISIATSQNPSGVSIPLATIKQLLAIMDEKAPNAYLLIDETYREAAYSAETLIPSAASLSPRVITCASVSKAYGAPALRTGWLTLPDATMRQKIINAKQNTVICDSKLTETLATAILQNADTLLQQQRAHIAPALALVKEWQAGHRQYVDWAEPDAGALCCMRLSPAHFDDDGVTAFWESLEQTETIVRPGLLFGSDTRHFRLGFGHIPYQMLEKGLENIAIALASGAS